MKLVATVVLLLGAFALANARPTFGPFSFGECPAIPTQDDFSLDKFSGVWYEQMKFPFFLELGTKCVTFNISRAYGKISIDTTQLTTLMNLPLWSYGSLTVPDSTKPAEMKWKFYSWFYVPLKYHVIATDYKTYAMVYSCRQMTYFGYGVHQDNVWIMTRSRSAELQSSVLNDLMERLRTNHVDTNNFMETDNASCD